MKEEVWKKVNKKGITLVALVVTIVVLIILATISINIIFGEEGIVERAKQAKQDMANAQEEEQELLAEASNKIGQEIKGNRENVVSKGVTVTTIYEDYTSTTSAKGNTYTMQDSIENYDYIKIYIRCHYNNATSGTQYWYRNDTRTLPTSDYTFSTNSPIVFNYYHTNNIAYYIDIRIAPAYGLNKIYVAASSNTGFSYNPVVYKVEGIKID